MPHASFACHATVALLLQIALLMSLLYASPPKPQSESLTRKYDFTKAIDTWSPDNRPAEVPAAAGFGELSGKSARLANSLDKNGAKVGRYIGRDLSNREVVKFLVCRGVVNANIHIVATVYLMEEGTDENGYWCRLVSVDPYWTNRQYVATYDFAIRIDREGTLFMMHPDHVGNADPQPNEDTATQHPK